MGAGNLKPTFRSGGHQEPSAGDVGRERQAGSDSSPIRSRFARKWEDGLMPAAQVGRWGGKQVLTKTCGHSISNTPVTGTWSDGFSQPRASLRISIERAASTRVGLAQI